MFVNFALRPLLFGFRTLFFFSSHQLFCGTRVEEELKICSCTPPTPEIMKSYNVVKFDKHRKLSNYKNWLHLNHFFCYRGKENLWSTSNFWSIHKLWRFYGPKEYDWHESTQRKPQNIWVLIFWMVVANATTLSTKAISTNVYKMSRIFFAAVSIFTIFQKKCWKMKDEQFLCLLFAGTQSKVLFHASW